MKIAIPHWQGRVSPVFDVAGSLLLVEVNDGRELRREEVSLAPADAAGRAEDVLRLGADVLVCGAISSALEARLRSTGIAVTGFVCGPVEEILAGFLNGELTGPAFRMPGCRGRRRRMGQSTNRMAQGRGSDSGGGRGRGAGGRRVRRRRGGELPAGPGGDCVCPQCGEKTPHSPGKPCVQILCPRCGAPMTRA